MAAISRRGQIHRADAGYDACWCIIRVIYVTVAVKFFPVLQTVSWAYPITWGLSTLVFTLYYFKADWMHAFEGAKNTPDRPLGALPVAVSRRRILFLLFGARPFCRILHFPSVFFCTFQLFKRNRL
ncbi:MAG: hypothetical protein ACLUI3_14200 [Christensenellales bacterium]